MVDTVMTNDHDDWEIAVDTGEFDKRLEQQEKDRTATQESILSSTSSSFDNEDNQNSSSINLITSNKPIRILKRPANQSQLSVSNDITNSNTTIITNNNNNNNSPFSNNISSSATVPVISIIPRNLTKESINSSLQIVNPSSSSSLQPIKTAIKTYEQRELEYRLARLRIMGEEESSTKDDDDGADNPITESTSITSSESTKTTCSPTSTKTSNKTTSSSQPSLQNNSTPDNYISTSTEVIHFPPNINSIESLSQQHYHGAYPISYPQMSLASRRIS